MKNNKKIALLLVMGVVAAGYVANSTGATKSLSAKMISDKKVAFDKFLKDAKYTDAQNIVNELSRISGQRNTVDAMQKKLMDAYATNSQKIQDDLNETLALMEQRGIDISDFDLEDQIEKLKKNNEQLAAQNIANMRDHSLLNTALTGIYTAILGENDAYKNIEDLKEGSNFYKQTIAKCNAGAQGDAAQQRDAAIKLIKEIIQQASNSGYLIIPGAIGLALGMKPEEVTKKTSLGVAGMKLQELQWPSQSDLKKMQTAATTQNKESVVALVKEFDRFYEKQVNKAEEWSTTLEAMNAAAKNPTADLAKELDKKFDQYFKVRGEV